MITRNQYMKGEATHRQYYAQFVDEDIKYAVIKQIGKDKLKSSKDEYFNDIPLKLWDDLHLGKSAFEIRVKMELTGDFLTLAGKVCILKEAGRQVLEDLKFIRSEL